MTNLGDRDDLDVVDFQFSDADFTDEDLCALALAADPDEPLDAEAVALNLHPEYGAGFLPTWYMPPVMSRGSKAWRTPVVLSIVGALLSIDAFGLCITYGRVVGA